MKLDRKQQAALLRTARAGMVFETNEDWRKNPYTQVGHKLSPLAVSLYDWIVSPDRGDNIASGKEKRETWDEARYLFAELWPDEYIDLID